jgi:aconitate hydratase 2/2-methylisocitrate dehydratase
MRPSFAAMAATSADDKYTSAAATIEINLDDIKEPILACPNDPDDVKLLTI